ncbi:MAG: YdiU family protein [Candidatus Izimaplasma sp.]|nr:YdiU family protein [Candidatus Izimaplasma bacterium]
MIHNNHSYLTLDPKLYSIIKPYKAKTSDWVLFNHDLAKDLDLNSLYDTYGKAYLTGTLENKIYFAEAYAGHQFGHFTFLGDGRALNIGEILHNDKYYDIQLKGTGKTPYSRRGDGKATLYSMLREYMISDALNGLGVPTTRTLSVIKTNDSVQREIRHEGAIASRIASSHIRIGTFQFAHVKGDTPLVKDLADYAINRHYPSVQNNYYKFFHHIMKAQAKLVAHWQSLGFIHGVLNTDNVLISGEAIDFGPCAFMDTYDPETVYSLIDHQKRYKYDNQPLITSWNLARLAETLYPLFDNNEAIAIQKANKLVASFEEIYTYYYNDFMRKKLGLTTPNPALVKQLLNIMRLHKRDYTNSFVMLTVDDVGDLLNMDGFQAWYDQWQSIKKTQKNDSKSLMMANNPRIIPRNHLVEKALQDFAFDNNQTAFNELLGLLKNPYDYDQVIDAQFLQKNPNDDSYKTYCGT